MLESNPDQDPLSSLGPVPDDFRSIVTRTLGNRRVTVEYADELLASLGDVNAIELPPAAPSLEAAPAGVESTAAAAAPAGAAAQAGSELAAAASAPVSPVFPVLSALVDRAGPNEATLPMFTEPQAESRPEVAQVFDSRPAPSPVPPPLFDARPAPSSIPSQSVFDDPPSEDEESPDAEAQAQAIEAAFDVRESEASARAQHLARKNSLIPPPSAASALPRSPRGGSRRPDLDHLLDQPLDALDFQRAEAVAASSEPPAEVSLSVAPTPPPAAAEPAPAAGAGDDFEILVDDEILEIAEDDVEIVDDEK